MNWKTFLSELHVSAPALFAGITGGSIMVLKYREISWRRAIGLVISSAVASGYLTEITVHGLGLPDGFIGAIGFCIGLFFILVLDAIVSLLKFIAANPKAIFNLLISFIPRKNKNNEETFIDDTGSTDDSNSTEPGSQQGQP